MKVIKKVTVFPGGVQDFWTSKELRDFVGHETADGGKIVGIGRSHELDHNKIEWAEIVVEFDILPSVDVSKGVWYVYDLNAKPYPISVHDNEVDALRMANENYGCVTFWEFGEHWDAVHR